MEDKKFLETALQKITSFREAVLNDIPDSMDKRKLLGYIDEAILGLKSSKKVNNKTFINLERFYQSSSMLIGLSTLRLEGVCYITWRDYDKFHFEKMTCSVTSNGRENLLFEFSLFSCVDSHESSLQESLGGAFSF